MSVFFGWAGSVCAVAAGCTLVHMLVGKAGMGKVFRLLSTALLICVALLPLKGVLEEFDIPTFSPEENVGSDMEETALRQLESLTESVILTEVNQALAAYQLSAEKAEVTMDISEDGSISITDVLLYIPNGNTLHRSWVAQIAGARLGMEVAVEYVNGG